MKGKYIGLLFIVLLIPLVLITVAEASEMNLFYQVENNDTLNSPNLLGLYLENNLNDNYLITFLGATGNIIGDKENCQQFNVNIYKKISVKSDFDYYLGAGYNYFSDDSEGLDKNLLSFNLKGINKKESYVVISEVSYVPLGTYSFAGNNLQNMNVWEIKLSYKKMLTDNLNINLTGTMAGENYQEFSNSKNSYMVGLGWEL